MTYTVQENKGAYDRQSLSRRNFLKVTGGLAALVLGATPIRSEACIGSNAANAFYEKIIKPEINNPKLLENSPDGSVYVRMNIPINTLIDVFNNPDKYKSYSDTKGNEVLYRTLDEAVKAKPNHNDTHIIEIEKGGFVKKVHKVFNDQGIDKAVDLNVRILTLRSLSGCGTSYSLQK